MIRPVPRLHAVTSDDILASPNFAERARELARPGVALHARGPASSGRQLTTAAAILTAAAHAGGASALVNDRADVARIVGADGVHLPETGLGVAAVRRILGEAHLVGRSVHSAEGARRAADEGADYVFLGPIWDTASHPTRQPLGTGVLAEARGIPVIAIGGVTPDRVRACLDSGAWGVAAVSALWHAGDPASAVDRMLVDLEQ